MTESIGTNNKTIHKFVDGKLQKVDDHIVVEDPLEIIIVQSKDQVKKKFTLSITMRTPGDDFNLVKGFLFSEGIIDQIEDIKKIRYVPTKSNVQIRSSSVEVHLTDDAAVDEEALSRHFYTASSCGVCGKTAIEQLQTHFSFILKKEENIITPEVILQTRNKLFKLQDQFQQTGGIHATALLDVNGDIICIKEDVGRHNAFDKMIGQVLSDGLVPLSDKAVIVSGRASFELVQKALSVGIPIFLSIGAPSSLACELAEAHGQSLIGFIKKDQFNMYSYPERLKT